VDNLRYLFAVQVRALLVLADEACTPVMGNVLKLFLDYKDGFSEYRHSGMDAGNQSQGW